MRRFTISSRIFAMLALMVLFYTGIFAIFRINSFQLEDVAVERAHVLLTEQSKLRIQAATHSVALALGEAASRAPNKEDKLDVIAKSIETLRFENDKSGYYYVYEGTVCVAHPTVKDLISKDLANTKDSNGTAYIHDLEKAARSGGGFVSFVFSKLGKGDRPKLGYGEMIPGTPYWIGTGIYMDNIAQEQERFSKAMDEKRHAAFLWALGVSALLLVAVVLPLSVYVIRSIVRPIAQTTGAAGRIAKGDYDVELDVVGKDECASLQTALNTMSRKLRDNMTAIGEASAKARQEAQNAEEARTRTEEAMHEATVRAVEMERAALSLGKMADVLDKASGGLLELVEVARDGAMEQAGLIGETATAMEEMNATVLEVARNAAEAAKTTGQAKSDALSGESMVEKVVAGIGDVQRQALELKSEMADLGTRTEGIGHILEVISDIADQTNLLALNAAIEAARAGEAGRGFAVVADEVRKLAEKTMAATRLVGEAITAVQQGARANIMRVDAAVSAIDEATGLAQESGHSLDHIVKLVELAADQVHSIATAAEQQSASSEEITRALDKVNSVSEQTSSAMSDASGAVEELAGQSRELASLAGVMQNGQGTVAIGR